MLDIEPPRETAAVVPDVKNSHRLALFDAGKMVGMAHPAKSDRAGPNSILGGHTHEPYLS